MCTHQGNSLFRFQTIFEINSTSKNTAFGVMKTKRQFHSTAIAKNEEKVKEQLEEFNTDHGRERTQTQEECTDADLEVSTVNSS